MHCSHHAEIFNPIQYNIYRQSNSFPTTCTKEFTRDEQQTDMGSVPNTVNYIKPLFVGNKHNSCTNNYGTLIYEFNQGNR
jgi:hypothetical protein